MARLIRKILEDIRRGENVDLLVTIALVLVISVLKGLNLASADLVSSITLATLGLIAIGFLVTRYRLEKIYHKEDVTNSFQFFEQKLPALDNRLRNSNEIWMIGITLRGTTTANFHNFKRKAAQGCKFRTLIIDINQVDKGKILKQFSRGGEDMQFQAEFEQTLNQYKEIYQSSTDPKNVELKLLDFLPPFRLYIFPSLEEEGIVYVDFYGYKSTLVTIPKIQVNEFGQPRWYKYFVSQFENMWKDAKAANLKYR